SFKQSLCGLQQALMRKKLIVSVDIVINKINFRFIKDIIEFFSNLGVREFDLLYVIPFGNAWKNRKEILLDAKRARSYLQKAFEFARANNIALWTNRMPIESLEGWENLIQKSDKISDEILYQKTMFKGFVKGKSDLHCMPARCKYCYLNIFCEDLVKLKKQGVITSKSTPRCLKYKSKEIIKKFRIENFNLVKFIDFFIKYRYFVKSSKCAACSYNKICDGAHIDIIRKKGFKCLSPINKK
ncbi:hypothetical protein K8R32_04460, partial [bacterium]|nr:hypothetical protein [bacterium]